MPITFSCPMCGKQLRVNDEHVGKVSKCPSCGETVKAPSPITAETPLATPGQPFKMLSTERDEKPCPYCAEPILRQAKKCKHCGEIVDSALRPPKQAAAVEDPGSRPTIIVRGSPAGYEEALFYCGVCERKMPAHRKSKHHGVHFIIVGLTLLLGLFVFPGFLCIAGCWLVVWLLIAIGDNYFHCSGCGHVYR